MSIHKAAIKTINTMGDAGIFLLDGIGTLASKAGYVIAPAVTGAIGGALTGIGYPMGFFQGAMSGLTYIGIIRPVGTFIKNNTGDEKEEDKIHGNAVAFLGVCGTITAVALPILLTSNFGQFGLSKASDYLPLVGSYFKTDPARDYTWLRGACTHVAPAFTQLILAIFDRKF